MLFFQTRTSDDTASKYILEIDDKELVNAEFFSLEGILPRKDDTISKQLENLTIIARAIEIRMSNGIETESRGDSPL